MGPLEVLKEVLNRFETNNIDYFLVGSLASMHYGKPRFTNDVDLVVRIRPNQVAAFEASFSIETFYCPPSEIIRDEVLRGGSFNLIHHESGVKIDIVLHNKTPFYESEWLRRRKVEVLPGFEIYIASPEDVVIKKLDFYREGGSEKHLTDIKSILIETKDIDYEYLNLWIKKFGLEEPWEKIQ